MQPDDYIYGLRAIIEAIQAGRDIDRIYMKPDLNGPLASELMALVRQHRIECRRVPQERLNKITRKNHQGAIAIISAVTYYNLEDVLPRLYEEGAIPFVVVLDGITDVRNFGAIARTCECAGVDTIVIPARHGVSVTADAVKTSAGALLSLPVCRVQSVAAAVRYLRESGCAIAAVTEKATDFYTAADFRVPTALVLGAEDSGISPEVLRQADSLLKIPMFGQIGSLNVSVAAGITLYEVVRQRLADSIRPD